LPTVRLDIEYVGSAFRGWARQPGERTVQNELEAALETILRRPVALTVAGRTDAGVHALGQVASFTVDEELPAALLRSVNAVLSDDVAVRSLESAADGFDARRDAVSRTYRYRLLVRPAPSPFEKARSLWWPTRLDEDVLHRCAAALPGVRDFTAFTPTETDHTRFKRNVSLAEWRREGEMLEFWIAADGFIHHMVRILVGTMLEMAAGRRDPAEFPGLLTGAPRERAGLTAPARGLCLMAVEYGE